MIFYQILLTHFLRKCIEISLENLYDCVLLGLKVLKISPAARNKPVFVQAMNSTEDELIICYCTILTSQGLQKKEQKI